ncbi:hypothetical protein QBC47DRAFT_429895 [Echria macrotheca]|uniref:Uncharacterized protein n=1 Tax=Echria macrotheca TaxID=438768 RepID=A0AAJ0BCH0_9PEZI|nr:hypothetical protein QBC47DRAFT_429895 [Echria macrotheca]
MANSSPSLRQPRSASASEREIFVSPGPLPKNLGCQLVPPCSQGRHGLHFSPIASEWRKSNVLGKYHMTEEGLKHDLAALRKGEIYRKADFFARARAWYKAEVDRLTHLERVMAEGGGGTDQETKTVHVIPTEAKPVEEKPVVSIESDKKKRGKKPHREPTPPTRIQPPRAAKRKQLPSEPAPLKQKPRPAKKIKTKTTEDLSRLSPSVSVRSSSTSPETKGDYSLAAYDWASYKSTNQARAAEAAAAPANRNKADSPSTWTWPYVHPEGDAAYFITRLERVTEARIAELEELKQARLNSAAQGRDRSRTWVCGLGDNFRVESEFEPAARRTPEGSRAASEKAETASKNEDKGQTAEEPEPASKILGKWDQSKGFQVGGSDDEKAVVTPPYNPFAVKVQRDVRPADWKLRPELYIPVAEFKDGSEDDDVEIIIDIDEKDEKYLGEDPVTKAEIEEIERQLQEPDEKESQHGGSNNSEAARARDLQLEQELFGYEGGPDDDIEIDIYSDENDSVHDSAVHDSGMPSEAPTPNKSPASPGDQEPDTVVIKEEKLSGSIVDIPVVIKEEKLSGSIVDIPSHKDDNGGYHHVRKATIPGGAKKGGNNPGAEGSRPGSVAPEAEMTISPALGRWADVSGDGSHVENLKQRALEVSGLVFAVDVCHEEVLFLMI